MLIWVLRGLFVILLAAVALTAVSEPGPGADDLELQTYSVWFMLSAIAVAVILIAIDVLLPRKSLAALSGAFLGLLVGMVVAYGLGLVLDLVVETYGLAPRDSNVVDAIRLMLGIICTYLAISFVLQTKDDVRFVIPYVEFAKQSRGNRPLILDTSVIIDGRVADICETRIIDSELIIPRFVLQELQTIADSSDKLKRNRGRRGLDMLNKLQTNDKIDIRISDTRLPAGEESGDVDQKLVALAKKIDGRIMTNDYNLNKIAQLRGVDVININDLANALKPVVLPGETVTVRIVKPGEEPGQGVGYLEDGTMVVAENSRDKINQEVTLAVTSVLQTSAGRMVFGRPDTGSSASTRRSSPRT
ncbi:MAG: PIN/TRAM domain-containing protein [Planctomycetota bacterium]|nr:MAG: PIN/TRAM domain-containing protein [Planctomycetota bacterium]